MAARVAELLLRCGGLDPVLPPTQLYNEGWLLRIARQVRARIPQILSLLRAGHGADRISAHLEFARTQQMSLPAAPSRDREFAQRIEAWWQARLAPG